MTTTFPKSYILERIDARLASLERQDVPDTATVAAWEAEQSGVALDWVAQIADRLAKATKAVAVEAKKVSAEPAPEEILKRADAIEKILSSLDSRWPKDPPWRTERSRRKEEANVASHNLRLRATERSALTHTRAYLTDTPVDEFSLTALSKLGLMDAIKFNLDQEAEAARAAEKGRRRR